jgi:hypothetical protein
MDAQNAPTGTWKTAQNAVSHTAHTHHRFQGEGRTEATTSTRFTHEISDTPVDGDPLLDIANTHRISGVILRGQYYDRAALEKVRAEVLAAPDIRVDDWGRMTVGSR